MSQFSIWIIPQGSVSDTITSLTKKIADDFGSPVFQTHITLIPDVVGEAEDNIKNVEEITKQTEAFSVSFNGVGLQWEMYFQCLYLTVRQDLQLMQLRENLVKKFTPHNRSLYMPHLSIMYGDNVPVETKSDIIGEIEDSLINTSYTVDSLYIYQTNNPVSSWRFIKKLPLVHKQQ